MTRRSKEPIYCHGTLKTKDVMDALWLHNLLDLVRVPMGGCMDEEGREEGRRRGEEEERRGNEW